jgi:very-short-patch-repair endonuclease
VGEPFRSTLFGAIMKRVQPMSGQDQPAVCDALGLPGAERDPALSKRQYIQRRLDLVAPSADQALAERFLDLHGEALPSCERYDLEEALWTAYPPPFAIPKKHRRNLAEAIGRGPLFLKARPFLEAVRRFWIAEDPLDMSPRGAVLLREVEQHVVRNEEDWDGDVFFEELGVYDACDRRVAKFIEALASADVWRDESEQRAFAERANGALRDAGVELREVDSAGGYPVFRVVPIGQSAGKPKNLIFASASKPDLRFRDAVNNDIEVVTHADQVLVYDRPIPSGGLCWRDLQAWWGERESQAPEAAKVSLYRRLLRSIPESSPGQRRLFETYFRACRPAIPDLPALLPEVWLHWDPKTVRERGAAALGRFRMDFLMLFPHDVRVVIEVDGKHHYSDPKGLGDPDRYAAMVQGDRDLRLSGYEVYRFGATELRQQDDNNIRQFFGRLLQRHGISDPTR